MPPNLFIPVESVSFYAKNSAVKKKIYTLSTSSSSSSYLWHRTSDHPVAAVFEKGCHTIPSSPILPAFGPTTNDNVLKWLMGSWPCWCNFRQSLRGGSHITVGSKFISLQYNILILQVCVFGMSGPHSLSQNLGRSFASVISSEAIAFTEAPPLSVTWISSAKNGAVSKLIASHS